MRRRHTFSDTLAQVRVKAGETIILCDSNKPFAEIRPLPVQASIKKRKLGLLAGRVRNDDGFSDTDAAIEADFLLGDVIPKVAPAASSPAKP